jgi:hypothetical protein
MNRLLQCTLVATSFAAGMAQAADYEEMRDLSLNASGVSSLRIKAGGGSLEVRGVSQSDTIIVKALIQVEGEREDRARELVQSDLVLSLEREGQGARLDAYFDDHGWVFGSDGNGRVALEVIVPTGISLSVDDGSGGMEIRNLAGDVRLNDGSGSITVIEVGGNVIIDDGSGSVSARDLGGDFAINDGSGSLSVSRVGGDVTIDDGSGSIEVTDVTGDLTVVSDGSGALDIAGVEGTVDTGT